MRHQAPPSAALLVAHSQTTVSLMHLSDQDIREFQALWQKEFQETLSVSVYRANRSRWLCEASVEEQARHG